jgi:hypothetical protein
VRIATREHLPVSAEEQEELRRFWGRVAFSIGMLAGLFPFAVPPLAISALGQQTAKLEVIALVAFCVTVLPASITAFWHRRFASLWLLLIGLLAAAAILAEQHTLSITRGIAPDYASDYLFIVPLGLAIFGIFTEWKRWPALLDRSGRQNGTASPL